MASILDSLIARVADEQLRAELQSAVADMRKVTDYGLVFEAHLPETVRLPNQPIRRGVKVALRSGTDGSLFEVQEVDGDAVTIRRLCRPDSTTLSIQERTPLQNETVAATSLVTVADFDDPIYPGLTQLASINRGGDKPTHIVIDGENYHVLETLQFSHAEKIDCIYIDPPYNSGKRDWKYNNDYVDSDDDHRHSKWLAFMGRRLSLAKTLLNPDDSVLICAIDEKEFLRLGLLLEQLFPQATVQMVATVVKPEGTGRFNEFSRTNEFIFFVMIGRATIAAGQDNMYDRDGSQTDNHIEWRNLRRREKSSKRGSRLNQFYAVFIDEETGRIVAVGDPLPDDVARSSVPVPTGTRAVFPLTPKGEEMIWGLVPDSLRELVAQGYARNADHTIQFLNEGIINGIISGDVIIKGYDDKGAIIAEYAIDAKHLMPKTVWVRDSHNTQASGTLLLKKLLPGRDFPSPKSLYAVEDAIRFFVKNKPDAVILDFFGGAGTTAHAVARLNKQDNGRRQSITVTNNEVSASEARALRLQGYSPGDPIWEENGIFQHITWPRIEAAITGMTPEGQPVTGKYRFTDKFPMSDGFNENFAFFELTYLDEAEIEVDKAFAGIAPLLWLRAGACGPITSELRNASGDIRAYAWTKQYGILFNTDRWRRFVKDRPSTATTAYIVTDSNTAFAHVVSELPNQLDTVRLYERYLTTFAMSRR